ncbi:MAG: DUF2948 family protein [Paracoccaceae bacterium]|jgi:hypothetical protein|nr:DUF2948 family protein [Paracoccaceae bacterium]
MVDASFEDGADQPLRLTAETPKDLSVISALLQDAVCKMGRVNWMPRRRRFSFLLYRFRWEDVDWADAQKREYERVATALTLDDVLAVRTRGVDNQNKEQVFNTLSAEFEAGEDGAGVLRVACSGDTMFEFKVECLNVALADLTQPWAAGGKPIH